MAPTSFYVEACTFALICCVAWEGLVLSSFFCPPRMVAILCFYYAMGYMGCPLLRGGTFFRRLRRQVYETGYGLHLFEMQGFSQTRWQMSPTDLAHKN